MADLVPVPASMAVGSPGGGLLTIGTAGEPLQQGQAVYLDATLQQWFRSSANTVGKDATAGIAFSTVAAALQKFTVMGDPNGQINLGCPLAAGVIYIASANLGGICAYVDGGAPGPGWKTCIIGYGISTTLMALMFRASGVAHL